MTTLAERISALPKMPATIGPYASPEMERIYTQEIMTHVLATQEVATARLALARDFILERMVDGCESCDGRGCTEDSSSDPCSACADARKILEVLK